MPSTTATPTPAPTADAVPSVAAAPAAVVARFLACLRDGDFGTLEELFTEDAWLRALLVKVVHESSTGAAAVEAFRDWVGSSHGRRMLESGHHSLAGREFLRYRFLVRPRFAPDTWHVVEQSGYCRVVEGRIRRMDLACTGYFPAGPGDLAAAGRGAGPD